MKYVFMFFFFWFFVGGIMCIVLPFKNAIIFGLGSAIAQVVLQILKKKWSVR